MGIFKPSRNIITGPGIISSATPTATGAGWTTDATTNPTLLVSKLNHQIITTVLFDLTGIASNASADKVVGKASVADASLTKLTSAINGFITDIEIYCIETPASSGTVCKDFDLYINNAALAGHASAAGTNLHAHGGNWAQGETGYAEDDEGDSTLPTGGSAIGHTAYFLHLVNGAATSSGTGTYNAGKFVVKLAGYNF